MLCAVLYVNKLSGNASRTVTYGSTMILAIVAAVVVQVLGSGAVSIQREYDWKVSKEVSFESDTYLFYSARAKDLFSVYLGNNPDIPHGVKYTSLKRLYGVLPAREFFANGVLTDVVISLACGYDRYAWVHNDSHSASSSVLRAIRSVRCRKER